MTIQLTESQKQAIQLALDFSVSDEKFFNIVGDSYTGKTTLVPHLAKELESFLKIYNSIVGEDTFVKVVVPKHRLKMEYLRHSSGIEAVQVHHIGVYGIRPTIFIIDDPYDNEHFYPDNYSRAISNGKSKFIFLTKNPKPNMKSYRLDPAIKPVKPVRLSREDFTTKLKEDIIKDSSNTAYVTALSSELVIDDSMDFLDKSKIAPNTVLKDYSAVSHLFENYVDTTFDGEPCKAYVFTDKSADVTNYKYILDKATVSSELKEFFKDTPDINYIDVDTILTPDSIIGLKFKNVYLHSEGSYNTPRHLQKVLGSALENLYILEN